MANYVLGMDIGYSNLKLAMGTQGTMLRTAVLPAGAGPLKLMPRTINGDVADCIQVSVGDETWAAGVEPTRLHGWSRELHADYPASASYRALFHAALLSTKQDTIDTLVTGLPVQQFLDAEKREALQARLSGRHQVAPGREVEVRSAIVMPQPAGGYMDIVRAAETSITDAILAGRTIVIDPGFFSLDWVVFDRGDMQYRSSGTSLKAMSVLLREVNDLIRADRGDAPGIERIEAAIRDGKREVLLFGSSVSLGGYLERAALEVAQAALTPLRAALREDDLGADIVMITGGGARAYHSAIASIFPKGRVLMPVDAVAANARGFWYCA